MQLHEKEYVQEVIEALVAELGVHNVPAEIDVDGAIALLNADDTEAQNAGEEESSDAEMEADAEVS